MKYKSFKDSQSLDAALIENVPQEFQNIVLREKNQVSEYQGLTGFFTLETGYEEGNPGPRPPRTSDCTAETCETDKEIISTGDDYWRPESSLSGFADETVAQDIVAKAQTDYRSYIINQSPTPRYANEGMTGSHTERPLSANSMHGKFTSLNSSRPSTARTRPISRAASEISEIESIDSTDGHDHFFEDEYERETLTILEKELVALKSNVLIVQQSLYSGELFQDSAPGRKHKNAEANSSVERSSMHALEKCAGESESDEEETLQDRLNVLSLP